MGGFTQFRLKDRSPENIEYHRQQLRKFGVRRDIDYITHDDQQAEFDEIEEQAKKGITTYPYWYGKEIKNWFHFVNAWEKHHRYKLGTFAFDCYFGRTSTHAMKCIARYILANYTSFESVVGSYETFVERSMGPRQRKRLNKTNLALHLSN